MPTAHPILIADDDPDIRDLLAVAVSRAGHQVAHSAVDGQDALDAARRLPIRLAVLDIAMPQLTGLQVCAALRADSATADLPIVLVSAAAEESAVREGLAAGASRYLTKPFSPRALATMITELLADDAQGGRPHA